MKKYVKDKHKDKILIKTERVKEKADLKFKIKSLNAEEIGLQSLILQDTLDS